jgi:hypothetical protein
MNCSKSFWIRGVLALSSCLCACGAGSGPGQTQSGPSILVSPGALVVDAVPGGSTPQAYLNCTVDTTGGDVYANATATGPGLLDLQTVPGQDPYTGKKTFQTHIWFKDQSSLGPGVYKDEITLSVCEDQACQRPVSGSPWVVPVTYTVEGAHLSVSPTELKLTHLTGDSPPTATLSLGGAGANWMASSDFPWIQLGAPKGRAPSTLTVGFDTSTLGPGAHTGTILLIDEDHQWFSAVPVTLTVI